jgi:hypothetical protein
MSADEQPLEPQATIDIYMNRPLIAMLQAIKPVSCLKSLHLNISIIGNPTI